MEKEGVETIEREDEMMSNEAFDVAADLNSTVSYGESLGVFTTKEAAEWYTGIDACTKVSHLRGLMPYLNRVIASGEARLRQLEKAVDSDLLTASEQRGYINEANGISYQAKGQLIEEVKSIVKELKDLRSRLLSILSQKKIDTADKSELIDKFYSASSHSKSGVVKEAENLRVTESKEPEPAISVEKQPEEKVHPKLELVNSVDKIKPDP